MGNQSIPLYILGQPSYELYAVRLSGADMTGGKSADWRSKLSAFLASGLPSGSLSANLCQRGSLKWQNEKLMERALLNHQRAIILSNLTLQVAEEENLRLQRKRAKQNHMEEARLWGENGQDDCHLFMHLTWFILYLLQKFSCHRPQS